MFRAPTVLVAAALAVTFAMACGNDPVLVTPRALDHAGSVAFICLDSTRYLSGNPLVPYENCVPTAEAAVAPNFVLHGLVTQDTRGEVASIDLINNIILDSQRVVPGFTFEPVGELPSAIVVADTDPTFTYVSNFGQLSIWARATRRFLPEDRRGGDLGAIPSTFSCELRSPVSDLVLSPDESTLYATLAEEGVVLEIPLTPWDPVAQQSPFGDADCSVRREIPLTAIVPAALPAAPREDFCLACPDAICDELIDPFPTGPGGTPLPFPPRDPATSIGTVPRPLRMTVDEEAGLLLVADERLPLVHVLDLETAGGATLLEPMNIGVPTQQVVVTPAVPATTTGTMATERFLYAIDGIDRSVIAADYVVDEVSRQPRVAVLPVSVRTDAPKDRLQIGPGARVLEVLTTFHYVVDPDTGELIGPGCAARETSSRSLRGVFLSVGANDGNIYVVDVHDLDATCRLDLGEMCDVENPGLVRRHRVRVDTAVPGGVKAVSSPSFTISSGSTVSVDDDGTTAANPSPRVIPFESNAETQCVGTDNQGKLSPSSDTADALVCGLRDPWAVVPEAWVATWEGEIPGTRGGRGRFVFEGDAVIVEGEVPFCSRGVLGGQNVAGLTGEPETGYVGDLMVITGELPPRPTNDVLGACCTRLFSGDDRLVELIDFTIERSFQDRLVITRPRFEVNDLLPAECGDPIIPLDPLDLVTACYDELFSYQIQTRDSYAVQGGVSGFPHRVTTTDDNSCVVDTTDDPLRQGRAFNSVLYDNGTVAFTLARAEGINYPARGDDLLFSFTVGDTPSQVVLPAGLLLNDLRFSPADQSLYSVDTGGLRGLARFTLDPVERTQTFE